MASTGNTLNNCLNQKRCTARLEFFYSANNRRKGKHGPRHLPSSQNRDALPRCPCPWIPRPEGFRPLSPAQLRAQGVMQPSGQAGATPGRSQRRWVTRSPALRVTSDPCTCYRSSPSLPRVGPALGAPSSALPQHTDPHRRIGEKRGAGRSGGSQPGPAQLSVLPGTGSAARPAPRTGTARPAPASAALSRARHRSELSSRAPVRLARLTRAAPRPPPPRGVGLASAAGADGGAGPGAERRRGRNRPRAWSAQLGLPLPQATELANRLSPTSSASTTRAGAAPPALLTEGRERRVPGGEGRTAAKPETDTAAILGPARCGGGRGGARWNSPRGEGGGEATEQRGGARAAARGRCGAAAAPLRAGEAGPRWERAGRGGA